MPIHSTPRAALQVSSCGAESVTGTAEAGAVYCSEASRNAYGNNGV